MRNKLAAVLILINLALLIFGNVVDSKPLWIYFDVYGVFASLFAGFCLLKTKA